MPIQTSAEEFLFRGFLLQFAGKLTANAVVLTVIIGGLFGALHFGNPEMENGALWAGIGYVTIGMIWTFITIKTGSLEMSLGGHAANNMFYLSFSQRIIRCTAAFRRYLQQQPAAMKYMIAYRLW